MERTAQSVIARCTALKNYWAPRQAKMLKWYRLIQMVDELKTDKMESFVGNDPRAMYNLVLHMLDTNIPHRLEAVDLNDFELSDANEKVGVLLETAWKDVETTFRKSGPRQSFKRAMIGLMLATGWYSIFAITSDNGEYCFAELWHPAQVFPMWSDNQLSEVAHIYNSDANTVKTMSRRNNWIVARAPQVREFILHDYWWLEYNVVGSVEVWNSVVIGGELVKYERTRFKSIPVYVAPVGGLPDTGPLSENTESITGQLNGERWKEEVGQSILATNENVYKTWNKWWSYGLQILRDTAQPRVFTKSASGKPIIRPEDLFRRGAIFQGGPQDSVEFLSTPVVPMEIRSTELDLEAMMQRGGPSWAMYGNVTGQMTAYVMSQISASAGQVTRPFHEAIMNLFSDIGNDWKDDIIARGIKPYGKGLPTVIKPEHKIIADYEIEIPGDLIQRATVARMLDPDFRLSYSYVMQKLFPDIRSPMRERARIRADQAELHPTNAMIALVQYYKMQSAYLVKVGDDESARLYQLAAEAAEAQIGATEQTQPANRVIGNRTEGLPQLPQAPVS